MGLTQGRILLQRDGNLLVSLFSGIGDLFVSRDWNFAESGMAASFPQVTVPSGDKSSATNLPSGDKSSSFMTCAAIAPRLVSTKRWRF